MNIALIALAKKFEDWWDLSAILRRQWSSAYPEGSTGRAPLPDASRGVDGKSTAAALSHLGV
jgi:hypothetical protein